MRNEHREGAFFVYKTNSPVVPYALLVQVDGSVQEHLIVSMQRPTPAFSLNGISAPVLYKLIHYFMENPVVGSTVLKYPVADPDVSHVRLTVKHLCIFIVQFSPLIPTALSV